MNAHSPRSILRRRNLVALAVLSATALVAAAGFAAGGVRRPQDAQDEAEVKERKFENAIPEHVPLKVKLKTEKSFKDLENKGWARELELEVKNTGSKPIHYLYVILLMPDVLLADGKQLSFRVSYGRSLLADANTPLRPDEPPIPPGESITLKIEEKRWKAYENAKEEEKRADPKRVRLVLQILAYGDGTGFEATTGAPLLYPPKRSSLDKPPAQGGGGACRPSPEEGVRASAVSFLKAASLPEPASLLRVLFFPPEPSPPPAARPRDLCGCQNIPNCFYGVITCPYQCPCDNHCQFETHVSTGSCSEPGGRCRLVELTHDDCDTEHNGKQKCSYDQILAVCGFAVSRAQESSPPEKGEREVVEKIPKHLPIKIKVKKPEKLKDLKNEEWLGELELEVTNTGTKPIYYLLIVLDLPDVFASSGLNIAFPLEYGRGALISISEPVRPDDVPILPGGVVVLSAPAVRVENWRRGRAKGTLTNPKRVEFFFQHINFGDGTGFIGTGGKPLPERKERSANSTCAGGANSGEVASVSDPPRYYFPELASLVTFLPPPASLVPAFSGKPVS